MVILFVSLRFFAPIVAIHALLDLNIPLTSIAFALVFFCLKVRTPEGSVREKLSRIDWVYAPPAVVTCSC